MRVGFFVRFMPSRSRAVRVPGELVRRSRARARRRRGSPHAADPRHPARSIVRGCGRIGGDGRGWHGGRPSSRRDEPVDLDNCAREPIHVPGSIQPRGVLLAVTEPDLVVRHTSENVAEVLGHPVDDVLGQHAGGPARRRTPPT